MKCKARAQTQLPIQHKSNQDAEELFDCTGGVIQTQSKPWSFRCWPKLISNISVKGSKPFQNLESPNLFNFQSIYLSKVIHCDVQWGINLKPPHVQWMVETPCLMVLRIGVSWVSGSSWAMAMAKCSSWHGSNYKKQTDLYIYIYIYYYV